MSGNKQSLRGKQPHYPELEKDLAKWIKNKRGNGNIVTSFHVKVQAKNMSQDKKYGVSKSFKFSNGWCQRFFSRYSLPRCHKTQIALNTSSNLDDKIVKFYSFIITLRQQYNFELSQIGNMDEVHIAFNVPRARIADESNSNTVPRTCNFTVVLCCLADGTKLNPMIIFKRSLIPKYEVFPSGVIVHCHSKGKVDAEGIDIWLKEVWNKRPGAVLNKSAMLVWDQFESHLTNRVKLVLNDMNSHQAVIPHGLSSILQPLDVALKKPFKDEFKNRLKSWIFSNNKQKTTEFFTNTPDLATIASWVKTAWNGLPRDVVSESFLKTGVSNKLDGTEDYMLWNCQDVTTDTLADMDQEEEMIEWNTDETPNQEECLQIVVKSEFDSNGI
ncbi:uncharacterized protein LOC115219962 [Argonauta hians]